MRNGIISRWPVRSWLKLWASLGERSGGGRRGFQGQRDVTKNGSSRCFKSWLHLFCRISERRSRILDADGRVKNPDAPTRLRPLPNFLDKDREPTLFENERAFRQTAQLVSDGWLPPEHTCKGVVSRTPFDEDRFREIASQIVEELKDD